MALPEWFCWTRFGTEAGQVVDEILRRKEEERIANAGVFFWGIGNAIGPSIRELLLRTAAPDVLFSPIKSVPRPQDVAPAAIVAWTSAETLTGERFLLPESSLVTSRYDLESPRERRYALVCSSTVPLRDSFCEDKINLSGVRNLITGRPVGSSQVTAVVQRACPQSDLASNYDILIRAKLVCPYFIRLRAPLLLTKTDVNQNWGTAVRQEWTQRMRV